MGGGAVAQGFMGIEILNKQLPVLTFYEHRGREVGKTSPSYFLKM